MAAYVSSQLDIWFSIKGALTNVTHDMYTKAFPLGSTDAVNKLESRSEL